MDVPANTPLRSPEAAAFRRYIWNLQDYLSSPVHLAELLFSAGIIRRETTERISLDEDLEQKKTLLNAVQYALVHSADANNVFQSFRSLWEQAGLDTSCIRVMERYIGGEYTIR